MLRGMGYRWCWMGRACLFIGEVLSFFWFSFVVLVCMWWWLGWFWGGSWGVVLGLGWMRQIIPEFLLAF